MPNVQRKSTPISISLQSYNGLNDERIKDAIKGAVCFVTDKNPDKHEFEILTSDITIPENTVLLPDFVVGEEKDKEEDNYQIYALCFNAQCFKITGDRYDFEQYYMLFANLHVNFDPLKEEEPMWCEFMDIKPMPWSRSIISMKIPMTYGETAFFGATVLTIFLASYYIESINSEEDEKMNRVLQAAYESRFKSGQLGLTESERMAKHYETYFFSLLNRQTIQWLVAWKDWVLVSLPMVLNTVFKLRLDRTKMVPIGLFIALRLMTKMKELATSGAFELAATAGGEFAMQSVRDILFSILQTIARSVVMSMGIHTLANTYPMKLLDREDEELKRLLRNEPVQVFDAKELPNSLINKFNNARVVSVELIGLQEACEKQLEVLTLSPYDLKTKDYSPIDGDVSQYVCIHIPNIESEHSAEQRHAYGITVEAAIGFYYDQGPSRVVRLTPQNYIEDMKSLTDNEVQSFNPVALQQQLTWRSAADKLLDLYNSGMTNEKYYGAMHIAMDATKTAMKYLNFDSVIEAGKSQSDYGRVPFLQSDPAVVSCFAEILCNLNFYLKKESIVDNLPDFKGDEKAGTFINPEHIIKLERPLHYRIKGSIEDGNVTFEGKALKFFDFDVSDERYEFYTVRFYETSDQTHSTVELQIPQSIHWDKHGPDFYNLVKDLPASFSKYKNHLKTAFYNRVDEIKNYNVFIKSVEDNSDSLAKWIHKVLKKLPPDNSFEVSTEAPPLTEELNFLQRYADHTGSLLDPGGYSIFDGTLNTMLSFTSDNVQKMKNVIGELVGKMHDLNRDQCFRQATEKIKELRAKEYESIYPLLETLANKMEGIPPEDRLRVAVRDMKKSVNRDTGNTGLGIKIGLFTQLLKITQLTARSNNLGILKKIAIFEILNKTFYKIRSLKGHWMFQDICRSTREIIDKNKVIIEERIHVTVRSWRWAVVVLGCMAFVPIVLCQKVVSRCGAKCNERYRRGQALEFLEKHNDPDFAITDDSDDSEDSDDDPNSDGLDPLHDLDVKNLRSMAKRR